MAKRDASSRESSWERRKGREVARQARETYADGIYWTPNPDGTVTRIYNGKIEQGDYQDRVRECQDLQSPADRDSLSRTSER